MEANLQTLLISPQEREHLSGLEWDGLFLGGLFTGVYRPRLLRHPAPLLTFAATQLFVALLVFIIILPIGYLSVQHPSLTSGQAAIPQFLAVTLGLTLSLLILWHSLIWFRITRMKTLLNLLDEIDQYNQTIAAIDVLDQLARVSALPLANLDREQVLQALHLVRHSLICGLISERIFRENQALIARRQDLCDRIASNLATLQTFTLTEQTSEYTALLTTALTIGREVYEAMQNCQRAQKS